MKTYKNTLFSLVLFLFGTVIALAQGSNNLNGIIQSVDTLPRPIIQLDSSMTLSTSSSQPGARGLFFVHGLGGDASSFTMLRTAIISDFRVHVASGSYNYNTGSMIDAHNELKVELFEDKSIQWLNNHNVDPMDNIVISHSQGGLVSRYYSQQMQTDPSLYLRAFNAIVTINTPHQGAAILNNSDWIPKLGAKICNDFSDGPETELTEKNFWFNAFGLDDVIDNIRLELCNVVGNTVLPNLASSYTDPITNYYNEGATWLSDLNNYNDPMPQLTVYGTEQEPVFFRTIHWLLNEPNTEPVFGADEIDELPSVEEGNALFAKYWSKVLIYNEREQDRLRRAHNWTWLSPVGVGWLGYWILDGKARKYRKIKNAYWKGAVTALNLNKYWKAIIGQRKIVNRIPITTSICHCEDYYGMTWMETMRPGIPCSEMCTEVDNYTHYQIEWEEGLSDGIVTEASQTGNPNTTSFIHLPATSHMQARNGTQLGLRFFEDALRDGESGPEFQLEEK